MSDGRSLVYLVTGGCGFLGRHLLGVFLEKEDRVCEIRLFDKVVDPRLTGHSTGNTVLCAQCTGLGGGSALGGDQHCAPIFVDPLHHQSLVRISPTLACLCRIGFVMLGGYYFFIFSKCSIGLFSCDHGGHNSSVIGDRMKNHFHPCISNAEMLSFEVTVLSLRVQHPI